MSVSSLTFRKCVVLLPRIDKQTWTDLVYSFEIPSYTKENRTIDLKLEYNTFRAKDSESLSQTYTCYKNLLNELSNDGVKLSKHEINIDFVNILLKKWMNFSQGLRNDNHIQTRNLNEIYEMFIYEDNLISRRYPESKKSLITAPISTAFFSNNVIQDFQENFHDEIDKRTIDEYLGYLGIEFQERALSAKSKCNQLELAGPMSFPSSHGLSHLFLSIIDHMASIYYSDMLLLFTLLLISGVVFVYRRRLPVTNWPVLGMTPEILLNCHRIHDFFTDIVILSNATFY
ncbi:retrovirus-related pol polyprotein from transposon TNT 1-94 [Tanacetum coccineum]